jgi:hypothetical protein
MLSRRNFLKLSGVAAAAIGSGYGIGRIISSGKKDEYLRVQAFLPDIESIRELTWIMGRKLNNSGKLTVVSERNITDLIKNAYYQDKNAISNDGKINIIINKLGNDFNSDILVSDNNINIYNPEHDFNGTLIHLRNRIRKAKSLYSFTAEYKNENILSSLFSAGEKNLVIENEDGIFDKIDLSADKDIFVKGPAGKTGIRIKNNSANIFSSCCRNGICKHSGAISEVSSIIACAPNKVLVYIEKVKC